MFNPLVFEWRRYSKYVIGAAKSNNKSMFGKERLYKNRVVDEVQYSKYLVAVYRKR